MARVEHAPVGGVERGERLERLYREQGGRMWRAVLAFAGDPEVASDAVAEAFAQALRRVTRSATRSDGSGERSSSSRRES